MSLQRLRENYTISLENIKEIPLTESTRLVEYEGKSYPCIAAYYVETSRYNFKNENGRIYSRKLWENVINKQKEVYEGGGGLANHPDGDGSVKDTFCIWHGLGLNENNQTIKSSMFLVGENGKLANDIIKAGGKIQLSSSGFGEFLEDNITVNESTYLLERVADWVMNASQRVFASAKDEIKHENINKDNSNKNLTIIKNGKNTIIENNVNKEINKNMDGDKILKSNEKALRLNIKNLLKEAEKKVNLKEKLIEYRDILTYCEDLPDIQEDIKKRIVVVNKTIEALAEKGLKTPALEKTITDTSKKLTESEAQLKVLKEQTSKLSKKFEVAKKLLAESKVGFIKLNKITQIEKANSNSKVKAEDYRLLAKENNDLKENVKKLTVENKYLTARVESFKSLNEVEKDANGKYPFEKGYEKPKDDDKKDDEKKDDKKDDKKDERTVSSINKKKIAEENGENEDSEEDKAEDEKEDADKAKKEESTEVVQMNFKETKKVNDYIIDLVKSDNRFIPYKESISGCKTLKEAMLKVLKLKESIEHPVLKEEVIDKIEESTEPVYKFPKRLKEVDCSRIIRKGWF